MRNFLATAVVCLFALLGTYAQLPFDSLRPGVTERAEVEKAFGPAK